MSKTERDNDRPETRVSVTRRGPLHVHESLKADESYHYRWVHRDANQPYKFVEKLELGYVPVEKSDLDDLRSKYGALVDNVTTEGNYISRPINSDITAILVKIPMDRHLELRAEQRARTKALEDQIQRDTKKPGFYGDFQVGEN